MVFEIFISGISRATTKVAAVFALGCHFIDAVIPNVFRVKKV
jgi:tetrahydromethanopterin S-methyltransferase subunit D